MTIRYPAPPLVPPPDDPRKEISVDISLEVNGSTEQLSVDPGVTLLDALRERLGITGPKKGCDRGQCGACTVHVDGRPVLACLTLAATVTPAGDHGRSTVRRGRAASGAAGVRRPGRPAVRVLHLRPDHVRRSPRSSRTSTTCASSCPATSAAARPTRTSSRRSTARSRRGGPMRPFELTAPTTVDAALAARRHVPGRRHHPGRPDEARRADARATCWTSTSSRCAASTPATGCGSARWSG